jgi:hypothetical protein
MASFVELKQHSRQIFEAHAAQSTDETAPQSITPEIVLFAGSLSAEGPLMLPVEADECGIYGWCSDGVEEKIRRAGGTIRFGWTIWEWPGLMLTAEFHAVWVDPAGQHHEITPKPQGETQIVFVPDSTYPRAFNFDERPIIAAIGFTGRLIR